MKSFSLIDIAILLCAVTVVGQAAPADQAATKAVRASFGKLPLYFVENRGVYADEVRYYIQGADKTLFFTDYGVTIALKGKEKGWAVKLDFVGANPEARPEGRDKQQAVFSYFKGPEKDWKAGLPTFSKIVYRDLWPGVDLVYRGTVNKLKYEFAVAPGADPKRIRLRYRGAEKLTITDDGALRVSTSEGEFEDAAPFAWQGIGGQRVSVEMKYLLGEAGDFEFALGDYDATKPLVLDPAVLVYCGFLGGSNTDRAYGIAVDPNGNLYLAGQTNSNDTTFPAKVGPGLKHGGSDDAFVAKLDPTGSTLIYCGFIGGPPATWGEGVAIDSAGNAYVTGGTYGGLPVKVGPDLTANGDIDVFVAKVNPQGTALVYCGYIGGSGRDAVQGIAVDGSGQAVVTGFTDSAETTFPVKVGPDLTHSAGSPGQNYDCFVAKIKAFPGAANPKDNLVYCGYVGGGAHDSGSGIAIDASGNAYVTGETCSPDFPVRVGPRLQFRGGPANMCTDAFVAKVNAQGTAFVYCGYIGGSDRDYGRDIAVDATGSVYVIGRTRSDEKSFPLKVGPDLTFNGSWDAFVAKVNPQGTDFVYCGYIGGDASDEGFGIAVDAAGNAYVVGITDSTQGSFPVGVGPDLTYNGNLDGFVAKVDTQGTALVYCGYIGGAHVDSGRRVAVDSRGNALMIGTTSSDEKTFPVKVGPDLIHNGRDDAFVAKIALTLLEAGGAPRPGGTVNFTLTSTDDAGLAYVLGSSFGTGPVKLGKRSIGLSVDKLLEVSVGNVLPTIFVGYQGVIGANGQAAAKINLPNIPLLVGNKIHTAFVTVSPKSPQGIKSISNTYSFTIVQ